MQPEHGKAKAKPREDGQQHDLEGASNEETMTAGGKAKLHRPQTFTDGSVKQEAAKKTLLQFIVFGFVGVLNTAVDIVVYWALLQLSISYIAANVLAYGAGMLNSYIWNNKVTFGKVAHPPNSEAGEAPNKTANLIKTRVPGSKGKALRFIVWNCITLLLSSLFIIVLVELIHWSELTSKLITTVIIVAVQFIGMKKWVFRD